jgi:hypothetical protein
MRYFAVLAVMMMAMAPTQAAPVTLTPAAQQDVRCFMLFAAAVNDAAKANNSKVREATSLAVMYFYGKLAVESPGLNIVDAVRQEANALSGNPVAKQVGAACDEEFAKRGQELRDVGQQLQQPEPQSSSSS